MKRPSSCGWRLALLFAATAVLPSHAAAPAANAATVQAVWVEQDIDFTYIPITAIYTCYGFRDKMRWILEQLGARADLKVTPFGCTKIPKLEPFPGVKIVGAEYTLDGGRVSFRLFSTETEGKMDLHELRNSMQRTYPRTRVEMRPDRPTRRSQTARGYGRLRD